MITQSRIYYLYEKMPVSVSSRILVMEAKGCNLNLSDAEK
jgi:hypothetical protein